MRINLATVARITRATNSTTITRIPPIAATDLGECMGFSCLQAHAVCPANGVPARALPLCRPSRRLGGLCDAATASCVFAHSLRGHGCRRRNKSGRAAVLSPNTHKDNPMTRTTPVLNRRLVCALVATASIATATLALADGTVHADAAHGKTLYQGCQACHSIDDNDLGPRHRGVVGRRAGSIQDYAYSEALKISGLTWDEATLDRWLTNPSALVPGTKMFFRIDDAQARADIIAYLKQLN